MKTSLNDQGTQEFKLDEMSLFDASTGRIIFPVYFSISETQKIDSSLLPGMRMVVLTEENGFEWVTEEALQKLSRMAQIVKTKLTQGLPGFLYSS